MKKALIAVVMVVTTLSLASSAEVSYKAADGVTVYADYVAARGQSRGLIALFHQADGSRLEYEKIAPKLNQMGFSTLAVDQRSGGSQFGGINKTAAQVKTSDYLSALPDLEASVRYAKDTLKVKRILIWGSSYSSALVFLLAAKNKEVSAVLSFSPDEYLPQKGSVVTAAKQVRVPVFITSASSEVAAAKRVFGAVGSADKTQFIPQGIGLHGSSVLSNPLTAGEYWVAVERFLTRFK